MANYLQIIEEVSSHHPVTFSDAEKEYNRSKNRFPDKLPSECSVVDCYFVCASYIHGLAC